MKKELQLRHFAFLLLFLIAANAKANVISTDVMITSTGELGSVQQISFEVLTGGSFTIDALGQLSMGAGYNPDPMIYLFSDDGSLDAGDLIASDDDSGAGLESRLVLNLNIGDYILSVSEFFFDVSQAISGIEDSIGASNTYIRAVIGSDQGVARFASVPEPAALTLLGLGLLGLGLGRHRSRG